ncbi:MAG TPA: histidinol-phosphate transaminase [Pusillimonas sp.]|uniref:histidinol-phosphate transaminase n=1 Tax=Pusillimonas sp. TaxID=3040095 RepID=UPI002CE97B62|nr:histidinol-phosphate transaminase [Pusillimonas sp.]HUH89028.1 histidinol-phosphate transaminase [Pusillimonas sp.]
MSRFWSDHVAGLVPYTPGEQPKVADLLKLNTNENPYGPSPLALKAMRQAADDRLRLYPDPASEQLRQAIAAHHGLKPAQVFVGNGSDEVLAHVFHGLFLRGGRPLLMPDITYSFYPTYCRLYHVPHEIVPLADDFSLTPNDYLGERARAAAGIIFANPNAPTGMVLGLDDISRIAQANPDTVVVVDEAYVDFGAESAVGLLARHDNLLVIHTFSKSRSLAGLRVGFAMGSADLIEGLRRVKDSFNSYPLDMLAQAGALAAFSDDEHFDRTRGAIMRSRDQLALRLDQMGFDVLPSMANFVFARHRSVDAVKLAGALRDRGILVRHFSLPRIDQHLRITVGTDADCTRLCSALTEILSNVQ